MKNAPKTVLLTGCSSGFGRLTLPLLLERGHTVIAALRGGEERMNQLFARELAAYPGKLVALDLHLDRPDAYGTARTLIDGRFGGKLDVLINNAGYGLFGALEDLDPAQLRQQMEVNFFGPSLLARELMPALRAARGRIINVSSIAGRASYPFYASYSASKFALEGMTEGLYHELKPHGVQVCLVEPGGFRTDFTTRSKVFVQPPGSAYLARTRALEHALDVATARLGNPARVARLIARLCDQRRIPLRQLIGTDAHFLALLGWLTPSTLRSRLVQWFFRVAVFRD